jgi:hypothetical protein
MFWVSVLCQPEPEGLVYVSIKGCRLILRSFTQSKGVPHQAKEAAFQSLHATHSPVVQMLSAYQIEAKLGWV